MAPPHSPAWAVGAADQSSVAGWALQSSDEEREIQNYTKCYTQTTFCMMHFMLLSRNPLPANTSAGAALAGAKSSEEWISSHSFQPFSWKWSKLNFQNCMYSMWVNKSTRSSLPSMPAGNCWMGTEGTWTPSDQSATSGWLKSGTGAVHSPWNSSLPTAFSAAACSSFSIYR